MKFAIFALVVLCAVAAHASYEVPEIDDFEIEPQYQITDQIRAEIEEHIKRATEEFGRVYNKVNEVMGGVRKQSRNIIMKAKGAVDKAKDNIERKLDELKTECGDFAKCAGEFHPEYRQVARDTIIALKNCEADTMVSNEDHRREVGKSLTAARINLREIRYQAADCLAWKTTKCIFEKTSELKKLLDGVISASHEALNLTIDHERKIITKAKKCIRGVNSKVITRIIDLKQKLFKCCEIDDVFF